MMKKFIPVFVLLLFAVNSIAQKSPVVVTHNEKVIGKNPITNTDIKVFEHIFPERIYDFYLDTLSGLLNIQLRGVTKNGKYLKNTGSVVQYDLKNRRAIWDKQFSFQTNQLQLYNNTIIETSANKSYCLDINTGTDLWEVKNNIYFVDPIVKIGVGYKYKTLEGYTNTLEGINLDNGEVIWKRELNREYGWNNIRYLNDSIVLVISSGLNTINIKNGLGWEYKLVTGEKDYTTTAIANTAGVALGLLTGTFVISTGHDVVRDIVSNVIEDSTDLYIASKEKISKVDKTNGAEIWSTILPKGMPSKSSIFMNDSLIFMINYAYAYMGNKLLDYGKPFIAAFNKENGKQKYLSIIVTEKDPILGYHLKQDTLYLLFNERVSKYSLIDGGRLVEKTFNAKEFGSLKNFIGRQVFTLKNDSTFSSLPLVDSTKCYIYSSKNKVYALDYNLNITETIAIDDLYINYLSSNGLKFLSKESKTIIIDSLNNKIAELPISSNAFIIGDKLYDIQEKSFFEINLKDITELNNVP